MAIIYVIRCIFIGIVFFELAEHGDIIIKFRSIRFMLNTSAKIQNHFYLTADNY